MGAMVELQRDQIRCSDDEHFRSNVFCQGDIVFRAGSRIESVVWRWSKNGGLNNCWQVVNECYPIRYAGPQGVVRYSGCQSQSQLAIVVIII